MTDAINYFVTTKNEGYYSVADPNNPYEQKSRWGLYAHATITRSRKDDATDAYTTTVHLEVFVAPFVGTADEASWMAYQYKEKGNALVTELINKALEAHDLNISYALSAV